MAGFQHILCPVDFSDCSARALTCAVAVARWYGARLTVMHAFVNLPVVDPVPLYRGHAIALKEVDRATATKDLTEFAAGIAGDLPAQTAVVDAANVQDEILTYAGVIGADLVVLGTHGRSGWQRLMLGSVAEHVAHKASCPVMLVPPARASTSSRGTVPFTRIVCGVDFAGESTRAFTIALELAEEADAHLTLVHVIEIPPELTTLAGEGGVDVPAVRAAAEAAALTRIRAMIPGEAYTYCKIHTEVREGRVYRELLKAAAEREAELIVIGVHGRSAFDRLVFGSNTHEIARHATCPVLIVRSADGAA